MNARLRLLLIATMTGALGAAQIEELGARRGRMILNGQWNFKPAAAADGRMTNGTWGTIWVPGSWRPKSNVPGIVAKGTGAAWTGFDALGTNVFHVWYRSKVRIPAHWRGRALALELRRVHTDATVWVNGVRCGVVNWPFGAVDITAAGKSAPVADVRILLLVSNLYDAATYARGLVGEVFLNSYPRGPHINDVFVHTSVRAWQLTLLSECVSLAQTGPLTLTPRIYTNDILVKTFAAQHVSLTGVVQQLSNTWAWSDPLLWDLGQPNMYTLKLEANGCGLDDEYVQDFGFREFWIAGREFYLNGTKFRMRPNLTPFGDGDYGSVFGHVAKIDGNFESMFWAGFNIIEDWPDSEDRRGKLYFRDIWLERADKKGMPYMGAMLPISDYINTWAASKEQYRQRMQKYMRRDRNHPSVLLWITSGNAGFGTQQDQNPVYLGMSNALNQNVSWNDRGREQVAMIKAADPTRPVATHHGGSVGDVHTCNNYLDFIPLQEREEWLSCWATNADMPYSAIEFGTPLDCSFYRGRNGFGSTIQTESLMTEFAAIYFGTTAYTNEPTTYRDWVKSRFIAGQSYTSSQTDPRMVWAPAFQALETLFNRNTYRSWRTMGASGGMLPWTQGHGWDTGYDTSSTTNCTFVAGYRGPFLASFQQRLSAGLRPPYTKTYPSGYAIMTNNGPAVAWICGPSNAFTLKDHNFYTNQMVQKCVALLNDFRSNVTYSFAWTVTNNGAHVTSGSGSGTIATAVTLFLPLEFTTPAIAAGKADGIIYLTATIGPRQQADTFGFRVFRAAPQP